MSHSYCTCPKGNRYEQEVEWGDVQSIVRRPYAHWRHSAHLILSITDTIQARAWLAKALDDVRVAGEIYQIDNPLEFGDKADKPHHLNIAFTSSGLRKLGVSQHDLDTFDPAFVEGMAPEPEAPEGYDQLQGDQRRIRTQGTTRRAGILGDIRENHSSNWIWGGTKTKPNGAETEDTASRVLQNQVDLMVMVFAADHAVIDDWIGRFKAESNGIIDPIAAVRQSTPSTHRTELSDYEHFGFKDGISQPLFADSRKARSVGQRWRELHQVAAGEFVLGYLNERDERAEVPSLDYQFAQDHALEHPCVNCQTLDRTRYDFGRNGTYLVARQLHQDVEAFDALVQRTANLIRDDLRGLPAGDEQGLPLQKAAEMLVGRKLDGKPMSTDVGKPHLREFVETSADGSVKRTTEEEFNDFTFHRTDQAGLHCPIGSHVRRCNPRDSLEPNPNTSLSLSKQHRILRRGRIYGPRLEPDGFKRSGTNAKDEVVERGLFFICLNTDIAGQFEFIQDTWVNNPNFGDLEGERDPLLAASIDTRVSLPSKPFTRWIERDKPPVVVRGGAYFFLPGRKALEALTLRQDDPKSMPAGTMVDGKVVPTPVDPDES